MQAPRPAHYQFAHRILAQDAHRAQGDTWPTLTGPNARAYLAMKWDLAGGDPASASLVQIVMNQPVAGHQLLVVAMPAPEAPTEAHFVAFVRPAIGGPLRYFVMEKGMSEPGQPPRAFTSEYRVGGMRVRHADLPAVSLEAFVAQVAGELAASVQAGPPMGAAMPPMGAAMPPMGAAMPMGTPMGHPSTVPMAVPHQRAPKGGSGKWFALATVGLLGVGGASYMAWQHMRMQEWQERRDARDAAAKTAEKDNKSARKKAEARLEEVGTPYETCLAEEKKTAKKALELARSKRAFKARNTRPKKATLGTIDNAMAYRMPTDKAPVALAFGGRNRTDWIPVSQWISRKGTACKAPPAAYTSLKQALAKAKPHDYAYDRQKQYEDHTEELTTLTDKLAGAGTQNAGKPSALVVASQSCKSTVVAHYDNVSGNALYAGGVDLLRYTCDASLTWIALDGKLLGRVTAKGSSHPGRQPPTTTASDLQGINATTHAAAREKANAQLQKTVNAWGGGSK